MLRMGEGIAWLTGIGSLSALDLRAEVVRCRTSVPAHKSGARG